MWLMDGVVYMELVYVRSPNPKTQEACPKHVKFHHGANMWMIWTVQNGPIFSSSLSRCWIKLGHNLILRSILQPAQEGWRKGFETIDKVQDISKGFQNN